MKRTKKKEKCVRYDVADAILTSDWHLRDDTPVSRTDNFYETQWKKLDFISELQKENDCPVIHAGDLFNVWKPSPALISKALEHLPNNFYTIYGNHDLPQHNLDLAYKCGIYTLEKAGRLTVLKGTHWNQKPKGPSLTIGNKRILVWHIFTFKTFGDFEVWPGCEAPRGNSILKSFGDFEIILTGDNHTPFESELNGRLLINPGSIFRMTTKQIDHRPRVYLYYADTNTVEKVYLPIEKNVISKEHLEVVQKRDERIDAFISTLDSNFETSLGFEDNLKKFLDKNKVTKDVKDIIYQSIDEIT